MDAKQLLYKEFKSWQEKTKKVSRNVNVSLSSVDKTSRSKCIFFCDRILDWCDKSLIGCIKNCLHRRNFVRELP
jgi:hypothetical protein